MDELIFLLEIILPAALVLYAMFLVVKSFLNKEIEKADLQHRANNSREVITIRLQAFERVILLLERLSPNNMVMRLNQSEISALELQHLMLADIRDEYNHNVSQQVYMSDESWELVKNAKEDLVISINTAAESLPKDASGTDLAKKLLEEMMSKDVDPITLAISEVKNEIRKSF